MTHLVLLAGGIGHRVGAGMPKQFVEVLGRPVIAYTLDIFERHSEIDDILIVCHREWRDFLDDLIKKNNYRKIVKVVNGGEDFQHSMINGMKGLVGMANDDDVVITHWAASPFVTEDVISDNIRVCKEKGNAMSACPFFLIVGSNDGDHSSKWVDRDSIIQLNAPQSFRYSLYRDFYTKAESEGLISQVEPHTTTLMYKMGIPIYYSKGNQLNIKITTQEDLVLFEGYLIAAQKRSGKMQRVVNARKEI